jgi:hypothetical protein
LRWFRFARVVAAVLAAALLSSPSHIAFSDRVKAYTSDMLIVLLLVVVVDRLAARRWTWRTTVAWTIGAVAIAAFSSFGLILTACAAVILIARSQGDRAMRLAGVAVQAVASGLIFLVELRSFNGPALTKYHTAKGVMIGRHHLPWRIGQHLDRVTDSYIGSPAWLTATLTAVALLGLVRMWLAAPRRTAGQYLVLVLGVAVVGSILDLLPLGAVDLHKTRFQIWLFPVLAFGLASAATAIARRLPTAPRTVLGAVTAAVAVIALAVGVGRDNVYPPAGTRTAVEPVMRDLRPGDVVWIGRRQVHAFALYAGTPYELAPDTTKLVGFTVDFDDRRLVSLRSDTTDDELIDTLTGARRVCMINVRGLDTEQAVRRTALLGRLGFGVVSARSVGNSTIQTLTRSSSEPAPS